MIYGMSGVVEQYRKAKEKRAQKFAALRAQENEMRKAREKEREAQRAEEHKARLAEKKRLKAEAAAKKAEEELKASEVCMGCQARMCG